MSSSCIHFSTEARVPSAISKRTGFCVLLCRTEARSLIWPDAITSTTFIFTRSQPRSLLSIAMLNRARSRWFSANSSRTRIAQTCYGFSGLFWPTIRPLFQAGRSARMAGKFSVSMTEPPIRHALPQRQPDVDHVKISHDVALPSRSAVSPDFRFSALPPKSACLCVAKVSMKP